MRKKSLIFLALGLLPLGSACAQAFVQAGGFATTSSSSFSPSFPSSTTAGNLILVGLDFTSSASFSSITDSQGNVFTQVGSELITPGGAHTRLYYASNIKGGADTVTVTLSATSAFIEVYLAEYSGVNQASPIDGQSGAFGNAGTVSSGFGNTTVPGDVIYGYCVSDGGCSVGTGFTARSTVDGNLIEDMIAGSPGAYNATGSASSGWTMQMVALKAATSTTPLNACDLVAPFGTIDASDVQSAINMSLGVSPCTSTIAGANVCNVVIVQRVINASLGSGCLTSTGLHVVALSWAPSTGATSYQISRGTASGGPYTILASSVATTSYVDTTVVSGVTYYYVVAAVSASGTSANSSQVSAPVPIP